MPPTVPAAAALLLVLVLSTGCLSGTTLPAIPTLTPTPTAPMDLFLAATGASGGEPTVGVTSKGVLLDQVGLATMRSADGGHTWKNVGAPITSVATLDAMLWLDPITDRVYVDQLLGACSLLAWSDDAGTTWTQNPLPCGGSLFDHQTIGSGPYAPPLAATPLYPNVVYYCTQAGASADCQRSLDGGYTWQLSGLPTHSAVDNCGGLHGHIRVGPDGTAYLPIQQCGAGSGVAVSRDDGLTWTVTPFPGSGAVNSDPSVDVTPDNTAYAIFEGADFLPYVSHSTDHGATWSKPVLAAPKGVRSTTFPALVAGDDGRIGFAYYGTKDTDKGPDGAPDDARWHVFVGVSVDADRASPTFALVQATPAKDPVQVGLICTQGTGCASGRNLLDFLGIAADKAGHVVVAYTDGCKKCTSKGESSRSDGMVAVETAGLLLRGPAAMRATPV